MPSPSSEIDNTIELLDFEPMVWRGLTQNEILYCAGVSLSIGGAIPFLTIGLLTQIWWMAMTAGIIGIVVTITYSTNKLSIMKDRYPDNLIWVAFEKIIQKRLGTSAGHFIENERFDINR